MSAPEPSPDAARADAGPPPADEDGPLLDAALTARLRALEFRVRRPLPSNLRGDRRSLLKKGISLEFADFRGYVPGDDVRHLDWSSYARLDQLIVKLYHDEEDVQLHLLVDDSRSMRFGRPEKARVARRIAAALAWIGLCHAQRVSVTLLGEALVGAPLRGGPAHLPRVIAALEERPEPGARSLNAAVKDLVRRRRPRGAVVLISDLLDRAGIDAILRPLQDRRTEVTLVQVLAPEETDPEYEGDLRLLDREDGRKVEVHLTPQVLAAYRQRVRHFVAHAAETARRRSAAYAFARSDEDVAAFLTRVLVQQGVLQ